MCIEYSQIISGASLALFEADYLTADYSRWSGVKSASKLIMLAAVSTMWLYHMFIWPNPKEKKKKRGK
jgi:hypothetical protein